MTKLYANDEITRFDGIEWFIEDQAFLRPSDSAPCPPPFHPPFPVSPLPLFLSLLCVALRANWHEKGGMGWARSQIIQRRENLFLYKSFNTLFPIHILHVYAFSFLNSLFSFVNMLNNIFCKRYAWQYSLICRFLLDFLKQYQKFILDCAQLAMEIEWMNYVIKLYIKYVNMYD